MDRTKRVKAQMKKIRAANIKKSAIERQIDKIKRGLNKELYKIKPIRNPRHLPTENIKVPVIGNLSKDMVIHYKFGGLYRKALIVELEEGVAQIQILSLHSLEESPDSELCVWKQNTLIL